MAFNPAHFVGLAATLDTGAAPTAEVHVRTACGRAYYGVFNVAVARLARVHLRPIGPSVHAWARDVLTRADDSRLIDLGQRLGALSRVRKRADYEMHHGPAMFALGVGRRAAISAQHWIVDLQGISDPDFLGALRRQGAR